jgi:predicted DNA-binding transcriptional regulator AlpA
MAKTAPQQPPAAPNKAPNNPPIRLIFRPELLELIGVSYVSIHNWMRAGAFPLSRELGPTGGRSCKIAWIESEVMDWLTNRPQRRMKPPLPRDGGKAA